jgi:N-acetylglucosamine malate deacetylase 1
MLRLLTLPFRAFRRLCIRYPRRCIVRSILRTYANWAPDLFLEDSPILVVAPHPDDEVFGAGGLIARCREQGQDVFILFLTRGETSLIGLSTLDPRVVWEERKRLADAAGQILGVAESRMLWADMACQQLPKKGEAGFREAVEVVAGIIRRVSPEVVYCPHPSDSWVDHEAAASLVREAVHAFGGTSRLRYYMVWGWYRMSIGKMMGLRRKAPRRVDISGVIEKKRAAIDVYLRSLDPGCGKPYSGVLPRGFVTPFLASAELFFDEPETERTGEGVYVPSGQSSSMRVPGRVCVRNVSDGST